MDTTPLLEKYYIMYLRKVCGLSESSVGHYTGALKTISQFLLQKEQIQSSIYTITDLEQLERLQRFLQSNLDFKELNARGHRMYSAGLSNYLRFANGTDFAKAREQHISIDIPVRSKPQTSVRHIWTRSDIIRKQCMELADYHCELDGSHESFLAESTHRRYMEGHHIIPLRKQGNFDYSLDAYANVICLCPLCHRRIHYGLNEDRISMMKTIYKERFDRLEQSGICISMDDFITLSMERQPEQ